MTLPNSSFTAAGGGGGGGGRPLNKTFSMTVQILSAVVLLIGILGNDLLLVILFRRRQEKKIRNIFIGNLVAADLTVLCLCMPYFVLDLIIGGNMTLVNEMHCRMNGALVSVGYTVSILSLLMITFHRYIKVCHRSLIPTLLPLLKNYKTCLFLWLLALLVNVPILAQLVPEYGYDRSSHLCNARAARTYPHYGSVAMICILLLPLLLIAFFNLAIYNHWYNSRRKLRRAGKRRKVKKTKETFKSFLSISLNNLPTLEETDIAIRESSNAESLIESRQSDSMVISDLTCSTFAPKPRINDIQLQNLGVKPSVKALVKSLEVDRNGQAGRQVVKPPIIPRTKIPKSDPTNDACDSATTSSYREKRCQKPQTKGRRTSLLCEALDLTATQPSTPQGLTTTHAASSSNGFPGTGCTPLNSSSARINCIAEDLHNMFRTFPFPLNPAASDNRGNFEETTLTRVEEDPSASVLETFEWFNSQDADTNSEPNYPNTGRASNNSRHLPQQRKSLYPSIDRGGQFLNRYPKLRLIKPKRKETSLFGTLLLIYMCVFVFYTPFIVTLILTFFLQDDLPAEVSVASTLMLFSNCAVNWIVYGAMNTAYRKEYLSTLADFKQCCSMSFRHRVTSTASSLGPVTHGVN